QEVDQGTPLFKVDDAQLKAQVAQLEAQRDLAQQALARAKDLAQQNASSTADLEKAEAEARGAQAQYDLQRIRLERTTVRAPFAGGGRGGAARAGGASTGGVASATPGGQPPVGRIWGRERAPSPRRLFHPAMLLGARGLRAVRPKAVVFPKGGVGPAGASRS